jgi:acyl dehydratase
MEIMDGAQPTLVRQLTQADINGYAALSGDRNPLHIDPDFAANSRFGRTVVHGQLLVGVLSSAICKIWGTDWYSRLALDVKFVAPVYAGDTVEAYLLESGEPEDDAAAQIRVEMKVGGRLAVVGIAKLKRDVNG